MILQAIAVFGVVVAAQVLLMSPRRPTILSSARTSVVKPATQTA